jgi:hypothetical protein
MFSSLQQHYKPFSNMRTGLCLRATDVGMEVGNTPGPLEQKNTKMGQESDESLGE